MQTDIVEGRKKRVLTMQPWRRKPAARQVTVKNLRVRAAVNKNEDEKHIEINYSERNGI